MLLRPLPMVRLPRRSIRVRLTAIYGGLFLLCGAAMLGITYLLVSSATAGYFSTAGPDGLTVGFTNGPHRAGPHDGAQPGLQRAGASGTSSLALTPRQARAMTYRMQALAAGQHSREMSQLLIYSGIALAVMAVVSVALGWVVAGRVLRPLRTITAAARQISATRLHQRLALSGPHDELKELGDTFDDLLGRLEDAFRAQRQFVANASHELRTPLAVQRTLAQVALADPDADAASLRAAHERVLASGEQQEKIIEALLTLTRGQTGIGTRQPFDLADLARQIMGARRSEARERGLDVRTALTPAPASGDPHLAERLVANLVDNALRHNSPGGCVEIVTGTTDAGAVLSVINTGPPVPETAVERILQPFQRLRAERTGHGEGLGLGLSIVQAIAQAHGGALAVRPQPGGGLAVQVSFPTPTPLTAAGRQAVGTFV